MRHKLSLFFILITVFTIIIAFNSISASAAQNVVFISSDGTGDGSSPNKPLGNASGYIIADGTDINNTFYRGLDKLKNTGGTLVIVGEVSIDTTNVRVPKSKTDVQTPCEFRCPQFKNGVNLIITSEYNGVDYGNKGAKLIFDYEKCNTTTFFFDCATTIFNLDIEYRYDPEIKNSWNTQFMLGGGGNSLVIGKNVNVTSYNTLTNSEGDQYPILMGGHRFSECKTTSLTVRSGTWSMVIGGSFGLMNNKNNYGRVGNATLNIEGGKIGTLIGTGSFRNPSNTVTNSLTITINGGEIGDFYISHDYEFSGNAINITLEKNAKIDNFFYAPDTYFGYVEELAAKVKIVNKSTVNTAFNTEETVLDETTSDPPADIPSADVANYEESILDLLNDDEYKFIHPKILTAVIICAVLIAVGFAARYFIKMQMVK